LVDRPRAEERLARLARELALLDDARQIGRDAYLADEALQQRVERALQVAIQACIDIATHFVASWGLGAPEGYADVFERLRLSGELDGELAEALMGAVGQRNLLVHAYLDIDHRIIWEKLSEVDGLRAFGVWAHGQL